MAFFGIDAAQEDPSEQFGILPAGAAPQSPRGIMDYLRNPAVRAALGGMSQGFAQAAVNGMPTGQGLAVGLAGGAQGVTSWEEQQAKSAAERVNQMAADRRGVTDYRYRLNLVAQRIAKEKGIPIEEAEIEAEQIMSSAPVEGRKELAGIQYQNAAALESLRDKIRRGQMITEADLRLATEPEIEKRRILAASQAEKEVAAPVDISNAENLMAQLGETRKVAERALSQSDWSTTGPVGTFLKIVPGTDAYDLDATLQTVRSNLGLDTLVALKSQGGTLGAVSEKELDLLLSKVASLDQAQSQEQFKSQLQEVLRMYDRTVSNIQKDLKVKHGDRAKRPAAPAGGVKRIRIDAQGNIR